MATRFLPHLGQSLWKHFFGRGLVDPEDDIARPTLRSTRVVGGTRFHLRRQQIRHEAIDPGHIPVENLRVRLHPQRLRVRTSITSPGIIPSVCGQGSARLIDDLTQVRTGFRGLPPERATMLDNSYNNRSYFLSVFGRPDNAMPASANDRGRDLQSLHLINSKDIQNKLSRGQGGLRNSPRTRTVRMPKKSRNSITSLRPFPQEELDLPWTAPARSKARTRNACGQRQILRGYCLGYFQYQGIPIQPVRRILIPRMQ